jgi:hypothetical protein
LAGIDQNHLESASLQNLEDGNPVNPRRFHGHGFDSALLEPGGQRFQIGGESAKRTDIFLGASGRNAGPMFPRANVDACGIGVD